MGEVILPFIEEERLLNSIEKVLDQLNPEEKERNKLKTPLLYSRCPMDTLEPESDNISGFI